MTYITIVEFFDEYTTSFSPEEMMIIIDHNSIKGNRKKHQSLLLRE